MYLKKLELQGFKSFPEKIKLEFNKGITAVVGPNGSGKSNVSDAVRWVLGEQSAKSLRGAKMEDIIFAGTDNRRPLGFAEVSMTIDNSDNKIPMDFSEIRVTRRVFRSGESEFSINNTACRLKDIHELFMDTGIGREGYSIIGQGRIEEILSAKSEDRRLLFEEAAGIVKFKNRKQEAETKLERERQNIVRVTDIISELEVQLEPLEMQSDKAKEYLSLKEQLKLIQINIFLIEAGASEEELKSIEKNIEDLQIQIESEKNNQSVHKERFEKIKESSLEADHRYKSINNELVEIRSSIEQKENDIKLTEEQGSFILKDIERLGTEIIKKQESILANEKEQEIFLSKADEETSKLKEREEYLAEKQVHFDQLSVRLSGYEEKTQAFNSEIIERIKLTTDIKSNIHRIDNLYDQLEDKKEQLNTSKESVKSQIQDKEIKADVLEKTMEEIDSVVTAVNKRLEIYSNERQRLQRESQELQTAISSTSKKYNETKSRYKILSEYEKGYEGYNKSVKSILREKKNNPEKFTGIVGSVAELLEVPRRFETAIEIALGSSAQSVVTKTENDAKEAIEYLKRTKEGRATFLPISAIKGREIGNDKERILKEPGVLGVAKGIVKYDDRLEGIISNILGRVIIIDNIENAILCFKKYNHNYKIVTLDGEVLNTGGAMTGGSINQKTTNILSRTREIKELKEIVEKLKLESELLNKKYEKSEEQIRIIKSKAHEAAEIIQQKAVEKASADQSLLETRNRLAGLLLEYEGYEKEDSLLMEQIIGANNELRRYNKTLEATESEIIEIQNNMDKYQLEMKADKEIKEEKTNELTEIKVEISGLQQIIKAAKDNIERIEKEINHSKIEIENFNKMIKDNETEQETKQEEVSDYKNSIVKLRNEQSLKQEELAKIDDYKEDIGLKITEMDKAQNDIVEQLSRLTNELTRFEMKREQINTETRRLYDVMWDEYKLTYNTAMEYPRLTENLPQMQKRERQIKNEIVDIGDVNVGAIEEYKNVKERFEFLTIQRNDIREAEAKLQILILDLIKLMEIQFREQFMIISENFAVVFKEMFGGGKAYLKLSDENNILESGIDIVAQPPGKNLQSMSLLSGGERALTATALLFGILRMKPSPFCILDEIEAALDDANVNRFAQYLKNFYKETQFILITHRKGTMEVADVLYGVTMQEVGVSKLVSVKFSEA